jgi:hypothetical protein
MANYVRNGSRFARMFPMPKDSWCFSKCPSFLFLGRGGRASRGKKGEDGREKGPHKEKNRKQ